MARISLISYDQADKEVQQVMDEHVAKGYRITNMKKTLLHSITSFQSLEDGFYNLQERLETFLDGQTIMFFAYAISTQDDCIVCSLYFKKLLDDAGLDINTFAFTDEQNLLIQLGREIVNNKGHVSDELLDQLVERYTEQQVVEIVSFATLMIANNLFNNVLQVKSELL